MATADASAGDGGPQCARDFVQERLREADSAMSPAELAEEYGCTNGHIRNLLSDLRSEGAVQRVGHGQYEAAVDDDDGESADLLTDLQAESEGNTQAERGDTDPDGTAEETPEPVDGQAHSEDPDTTGQYPAVGDEDRADMTGVDDDDREEIEAETVTVRSWSTGSYIVVGSVLLGLAVLWLSLREESETEPEQPVEDEPDDTDDSPNVADWGAE